MDYGEWTGLTFDEARAHDPEAYRLCMEKVERLPASQGRSFEELRERSVAAVKASRSSTPIRRSP